MGPIENSELSFLPSPALSFKFGLEHLDLGCVHFENARRLQEALVARRLLGEVNDTLLFCEHPSTITVGRNVPEIVFEDSLRCFRELSIPVLRTSRGGKATYHGPGQIVIYPVCSLRERKIGPRSFISRILSAIVEGVKSLGIEATASLHPAGIWVAEKKIGSVGLSIVNGVTNHGFSLNVSNTLSYYQYFTPCGLSPHLMSSLECLLGKPVEKENLILALYREIDRVLAE